jgi:hypothetical protein
MGSRPSWEDRVRGAFILARKEFRGLAMVTSARNAEADQKSKAI